MAEPHVITALTAKRAELAGALQATERKIDQLRADLVHLDATIRLFEPTADPGIIPPRRPYQRREWFSDGELPRRVLEALRTATEPVSPTDIVRGIMVQKGMDPGDGETLRLIRNCVHGYLRRPGRAVYAQPGPASPWPSALMKRAAMAHIVDSINWE